jgi:hypothetical protein
MVNTNYHKSINKVLISRNYFDALQKRLLLCNDHPERPGFAIGIMRDFEKGMTDTWNIWLAINKVTHNTAAVMRNRTWQSLMWTADPDTFITTKRHGKNEF